MAAYVDAPCPKCGRQDLVVQLRINPADSQERPVYRARCKGCGATWPLHFDADGLE